MAYQNDHLLFTESGQGNYSHRFQWPTFLTLQRVLWFSVQLSPVTSLHLAYYLPHRHLPAFFVMGELDLSRATGSLSPYLGIKERISF
ncbi:hypothetical protein CEXT_170241 [Caerostris extrusa]|uniref:Uncharacterized protein n=1 Tax=Caerostris extrusa TaxID=172846 RepID=A0AAV4YAP8_CAEEX|nr:hypothetical protein CEXT_170241 [Caerostris extrusa]